MVLDPADKPMHDSYGFYSFFITLTLEAEKKPRNLCFKLLEYAEKCNVTD